jgi:HD-like signal output (HDOD) protein
MASYDMASLGLGPARSAPKAPAAKAGQPQAASPEQSPVEGLESPLKLGGVAHLVRKIDSLPTLPETVRKIQVIKESGSGSVAEMADVLTKDPPIAAKLLQVVNSAAYGVPQRVRDIRQAASLLGMNEICSIVFSAAVIDVLGGTDQADYRRYWEDSFRCAHLARVIAKARRRENPVIYFTAGLLHDIGQLALLEVVRMYPGIYNRFSGTDLCAEEERSIGLTHMEAGFLLAERWNLPKDICNTIRFHHHPAQFVESFPPGPARDTIADIVATVSVADTIADTHRVMVHDSAEGMRMLNLEKGNLADLFRLALETLDTADQDNGEAAR